MAKPKLSIKLEPSEGGKAVFLPLAPVASGEKAMAKIVLRLEIKNNEASPVTVNGIQYSFPGSSAPATTMQGVNLFDQLKNIAPGATVIWSNGVVDLDPSEDKQNIVNNAIYLNAPAPSKVTVSLFCGGFADAAAVTADLAPHKNSAPQGAYQFLYSAGDLRVGEYIVTSARHWANGGSGGTQIFAHDIGAQAIDPQTKSWSRLLPGKDGSKNEHYRIYGKPVRAVADGTVESFHDGMADNTVLNKFPDPTPSPLGGNHFWIRHGNEVVLYAHLQKGSIPAGLKQKGAAVKAGQMLGRVGNTGNSTEPHTHIQAQRDSTSGPLRPLPFRDAWVLERGKFNPPDPTGPWFQLKGHGISKTDVAIWPAASAPAWYPPGWAELSRHGIPEADYQKEFDRIAGSGYRLVWIDGYDVGGKTFFNVIFRAGDGTAWVARHGLTSAGYQKEFDEWVGQKKFRLAHVESYLSGGKVRYAAIFVKAAGPAFTAYHGRTAEQHQQLFEDLTKDGFRPVNVTAVSPGGVRTYAALYEKKDVGGFFLKSFMTPAEYQQQFDANVKAGRRLAYLNAYTHGSGPRIIAIWQQKPPAQFTARHGLTSAQYQAEFDQNLAAGFLTRAVTGYEQGGHRFAAYWSK